MKNLYVLSDTHGNRDFDMLLHVTADADMYAHLGDYITDFDSLNNQTPKPVVGVKGNGDFKSDVPVWETIILGGAKILLLHGHTAGVKYSLDRLLYRALELEACCVCYGHTHVPRIDYERGVFLVCPGAFSRFNATYARLRIEDGVVTPDILTMQ